MRLLKREMQAREQHFHWSHLPTRWNSQTGKWMNTFSGKKPRFAQAHPEKQNIPPV